MTGIGDSPWRPYSAINRSLASVLVGRPVEGPPPDEEITFQGFHENTLLAGPDGVTLNGAPLEGTRLVMDRGIFGKLR